VGVLVYVLARAKAMPKQWLACAALMPCCWSVERHCAVGVAACEQPEEGALRNFRSLRTTAAGAFGEQDEVEDGMLGCEGGIDSSAGVYKGLELRCIWLTKMAAEVHFLEPRWLLAALARLRIPCAPPCPPPPSLACFPSVHSVSLFLSLILVWV